MGTKLALHCFVLTVFIQPMRWCHRFARHHFQLEHLPAHSDEEAAALSALLPAHLPGGHSDASTLTQQWTRWLHQTRSPLYMTMVRWRRRQMQPVSHTDREARLIERMSRGISEDLQSRLAYMDRPLPRDSIVPEPTALTPPRLEDVNEETTPPPSPAASPSTTE